MPVPTYGTSHKRFNITKAKNAMYMPASTSIMNPPKLGAPPPMKPGEQTLPSKAKVDWGGLATDLVPYISNIANSFRKPPLVKTPNTVSKPTAVRINLDNTRNEVRRKLRSSDLAASRTLDENSAAAVRAGNMAIGLNQLGQVNESEANANAQLAGQNRQMGLQTDMYNASVMNKYNDDVVSRGLAETRFQQQNMADAADKFMGQTAQRDAAKLDKEKAMIYSTMFKNSGVWNRNLEELKKMGIDVSKYGMKMYGGKMKKYADGGKLPGGDEDIEVIITDQDRKLAAKDSYSRNIFGKNTEALYASGFRPRSYGKDLIYTDNSQLFQTQENNKQIGYLPSGSGMRRVLINKDNSFDYSDDVNMDSDMVMNEIKRIHKGRSNQLVAKQKYGGSLKRRKLVN